MDNQITISNFKNPYLVFGGGASDPERAKLDEEIAKYQEQILKNILGIQLYNTMETNITDVLWTEFIKGKTYTVDSIVYKYKGIKTVLTNFIYYYWNIKQESQLVTDGAMVAGYVENKKIIPVSNMIDAFNDAVDLIDNDIQYDATVHHYLTNVYTGNEWIYTPYEKENIFGI